jgi:hypothetical protein
MKCIALLHCLKGFRTVIYNIFLESIFVIFIDRYRLITHFWRTKRCVLQSYVGYKVFVQSYNIYLEGFL